MFSTNELPYWITFGFLWLIFFCVRIYFQRKVKVIGEYSRFHIKREMLFFRLFALAYLLLVFYFLTTWLDFAGSLFPAWLRWCGAALIVAGILFFAWAHQALGNNWTIVLALAPQHQLVTSGPYKFIRHPMYTAFIIIGIGFFLLSANWLVGAIYFVPLLLMLITRLPDEEKMMLDHFGDTYRAYIQKTGSILPRIKRG